ncbi:MAG TPA: serine/threonine-protein kinase [Bryobacteraceae bacterium]|nr:serine/threonine-protein kinase [Bryobacteraceae bacterium]
MDFQPGARIGDYEILDLLGAGGMGKVYKVRNVLSDRIEAMKVILPALGQEGELTDRFIREIKVQASLDHPNITALRTAQQTGGQVLMIMEYVEGTTVDAMLRQGPLPPSDAVNYVSQVLDALEYAHSRGIVHRDIKPGNIMVTPSGLVKLMDFGIAKLSVDRKLTMTGRTLGSLYYMSPEQIQGAAAVDGRSDIYSLGICLYEMVTGKRPFAADSDYALMVAHLEQTPRPPVEIDPKLPEALSEIILLAIRKDPAQRFQSAAAFRAALASLTPHPAPEAATKTVAAPMQPAASQHNKSRRGLYMAFGSVITLSIIAAAITFGPKYFGSKHAASAPPPQVAPAPVAPAPPQPSPSPATAVEPPSQPAPAQPPAEERAAPPAKPRPAPTQQPAQATPRQLQMQPQRAQTVMNAAPPEAAPAPRPAPAAPAEPHVESPPQRPAADAAALSELREEYNQLALRAGVARSGLQSLQNQMGGLGLRADMRESAVRMDYLMQEARTALASGNAEGARRNLELATRVVERIEKFLGR